MDAAYGGSQGPGEVNEALSPSSSPSPPVTAANSSRVSSRFLESSGVSASTLSSSFRLAFGSKSTRSTSSLERRKRVYLETGTDVDGFRANESA